MRFYSRNAAERPNATPVTPPYELDEFWRPERLLGPAAAGSRVWVTF